MSSGIDYIPRSDGMFNGWANHLVTSVNDNAAAWNIPADVVNALLTLQAAWNSAYAVGGKGVRSTRSSKQTNKKTTARKKFVKAIRLFVKMWIAYNSAVSDADRTALQVAIHGGKRTPEKTPDTVPLVDIESLKGAILEFFFRVAANEEGVSHRGKPRHTMGMKIYYKVGDPAPTGVDDCYHSVTATRTPYRLILKQSDAGKKLYCYCCWVNHREIEGPLTQMKMEVVRV